MDLVKSMHSSNNENAEESLKYPLRSQWTFYAHLPHDTNWKLDSYKKLSDFDFMEKVIAINETVPEQMIKNCMLFLMRSHVKPIWEDKHNRDGGCFSYKISNKDVATVWRHLSYLATGESLLLDKHKTKAKINGITVSPKKNFCIIKIWLDGCGNKDATTINYSNIKGISPHGCLFRKHLNN